MQNINGQWVDTVAIEALLDSLDRQLDPAEWLERDEKFDNVNESAVEVRKTEYDSLVEGVHALKRRWIFARRMADEYKSEIVDLKEQVRDLESFILEDNFMVGWFDCLERNNEIQNYEQEKMLTDRDLPFSSDTQAKLYDMGFTRWKLVAFAKMKYEEWRKERDDEIQANQAQAAED